MGRACSTIKREKPESAPEQKAEEKRPDFSKKVVTQVEARLGTPENLDRFHAVDVDPENYFRTGKRYYRVNVSVHVTNVKGLTLGEKFKPVYPHSFYVVTDDDGNILSSKPEIEKKYPDKGTIRLTSTDCVEA